MKNLFSLHQATILFGTIIAVFIGIKVLDINFVTKTENNFSPNTFFISQDSIPIYKEIHTGAEQQIIADILKQTKGNATSSDIRNGLASLKGIQNDGPCGEASIIMVDLRGTPGFAQTDYLVTCGEVDTLALLLYTSSPTPLQDLVLTVDLPAGLEYGGFVESAQAGAIEEYNVSDLVHPSFILPEFTQDTFIVAYIGVRANCTGSPNVSQYYVDYNVAFDYTNTDGMTFSCQDDYRPNTEFNSAVRVPTLNVLSVTPPNLNFTALSQTLTHTIEISQDGIDSYLDSFVFKIHNLDLSVGIEIAQIAANSTPISNYQYDAGTQELCLTVPGIAFLGNIDPLGRPADEQFDDNERIRMYIRYRMPECHTTPLQEIEYAASYNCNGVECQNPSTLPATIEQNPSFGANLIATAELVQEGGFCSDNIIVDIMIQSTQTDSIMGLFEDMFIQLSSCNDDNVAIAQVTIGGQALPDSIYGIQGGFVELDLSKLTFDPDGVGVGLEDIDNDGRFDDLPGGYILDATIEFEMVCPTDASVCAAAGCEIFDVTVSGRKDCNERDLQVRDVLTDTIVFKYDSEMEYVNEEDINASIRGYSFPVFTTGSPATKTIDICYTSTAENLTVCDSGVTHLELDLKGRADEVFDAEISNVSFQGTGTTNVTVLDDVITNTRTFIINEGDSQNGTQLCYQFDITFDTCVCASATYLSLDARVVEECSGSCDCIISKGCASTLFRTDPTCTNCTCDIASSVNVNRISTGYTDKTLDEKLDITEIDSIDRNRFLPGDTMLITGTFDVLNEENVNKADFSLYFTFINRRADYLETSLGTEGMKALFDPAGMKMVKLEYIPVATSIPINLNGLTCTNAEPQNINSGLYAYGPHFSDDACPEQPAFPNVEPRDISTGSIRDELDGYYIRAAFFNWDIITNSIYQSHLNNSGDCLSPIWDMIGGSVANGDKFVFSLSVPLIANPEFDPAQEVGQVIIPDCFGRTYDNIGGIDVTVATDCSSIASYEFHDPEIEVENTINIDDCGGEIEHTFKVTNPPPVDWYQNEYRPVLGISQIYTDIPQPLVYSSGAEVTDVLGNTTPLIVDTTIFNPISATYNGVDYLTANTVIENKMRLVFQDEELKNGIENGYHCDLSDTKVSGGGTIPLLGVGLNNDDEISVRIPFERLCADEVDLADLEVGFDYAYPYLPDLNHAIWYCSGYGIDRGDCIAVGDTTIRFLYWADRTRDSRTNPNFSADTSNVYQITDNSNVFPELIASITSDVIVDFVGMSELNTYEVCAGAVGAGIHQNVVTSITIPNSVALLNVSDANGALAFSLVQATDSTKVYSINLANLAANDCVSLMIETEQLFCTTEPDDSKVCVATSSGCNPPEKTAAILGQLDGLTCTGANACYFYDIKDSGIQAEWIIEPSLETPLCSQVEFAIRVKNVKPGQLNDLNLQFWFPEGLNVDPTSWQFSYPNGLNNQAAFDPISSPAADPANDGAYGIAYHYLDDADFSSYIDANGLMGINANTIASDSNQFVIRFEATTDCEVFTSGSRLRFSVDAFGSCEAFVTSGITPSEPFIIEEANPVGYAQILTIVDPLSLNCGAEDIPLSITGLNVSETGETQNSVMTIILPNGIDYTGAGITFDVPSTFTPANFTTENLTNGTKLVFDLPDGITPNAFFKIEVPVNITEVLDCGAIDILADVTSLLPEVACSNGGTCGVFVRNTVNATTPLVIKAPFNVSDLSVLGQCEDDPNNITVNYSFDLENLSATDYNNFVNIEIIQDLNGNLIADDFETALASESQNVNIPSGDITTINGSFTLPEAGSCPSILKVTYSTNCACNTTEIVLDNIIPQFFADLGESQLLCPNEDLVFPYCGDYIFTLNPATAGTVSTTDDEVTVSLNEGEGAIVPVFLNIEGQLGACLIEETLPIYRLETFEIGPYTPQVVCETGCTGLNLELPAAMVGNVSILWSPSDYLDDPTSPNPQICDPESNITYSVTVTNEDGDCMATADYPVVINPTTIDNVLIGMCRYIEPGSSEVDVTVFVSWATPITAGQLINVEIGTELITIDPQTVSQPASVVFTIPSTGEMIDVEVYYANNPSCRDLVSTTLPIPCDGLLGNYVWEDTNANGIQDEVDTGIEGATVTLYDCTSGVKGDSLAVTTTNDMGLYVFEGLEAGDYCVRFDVSTSTHPSADGLIFTIPNTTNPANDDTNDSDAEADGCSSSVTLIDSDMNLTLDAGVVVLNKIGDFVWEDVNGNGLQDNGELGITNVDVTISGTTATGEDITTIVTATIQTGANGEYCFGDLPPGDYKVTFGQPTGMTPTTSDINSNNNDETDSDLDDMLMTPIVTLLSGDTIPTLDAGFYTPGKIGDFVWEDVNGNGLQDNNEPGITGVNVTISGMTTLNEDITTILPNVTVQTGANGEYCFGDLPPGDYKVTFGQPIGMTPTTSDVGADDTLDSDMNDMMMTSFVSILSGDTIPMLDAGFYTLGKLGDFVWDDLNGNGLQDNGELGIPNVDVTISGTTGDGTDITTIITNTTIQTGTNGEYCFGDLPPGDYKLTFGQPTGMTPTTSDINSNNNDETDSDLDDMLMTPIVTISSGDTIPMLDAGFYTLGKLGDFVWDDLNGNGLQDNGEPGIPNADVTISGTTGDGTDITTIITNTTIQTGTNGEYCFGDLPPGDYKLTFGQPTGMTPTTSDINSNNNDETDSDLDDMLMTPIVTISSGDTIPTLDAGFYTLGKLGDYVWEDFSNNGLQDAGEPGIPNVNVTISGTTGDGTDITTILANTTIQTGANGEYCFGDLPPGNYELTFAQPTDMMATISDVNSNGNDDLDSDLNDMLIIPTTTIQSGDTISTLDAGFNYLDFGDNPDSFGTTNTNNGPNHIINPDRYLGTGVDAELDATISPQADGDDSNTSTHTEGTVTTNGDDEDGIVFKTALIPNSEACIEVTATVGGVEPAYLTGWIDFNGDGDFDANEQLDFVVGTSTNVDAPISTGTNFFCFQVPANATFDGGETHARFRLSFETGVGPAGQVVGGEVEDYWLPLAKIGNWVWDDLDYDGEQDETITEGLNDVIVELVSTGLDGILGNSDDLTYTTMTANVNGIDGQYIFCGLTSGTYTINVVRPEGYMPTYVDETGSDVNDNDGTGYTFVIPDLINNFLPTGENSLADAPGSINNFPDTHDDLTIDFGFINAMISNIDGPNVPTPCHVVDDSNPDQVVFEDEVYISSSSGGVWTLIANSGFINPATGQEYPIGTIIPEIGTTGIYSLIGQHLDGVGYNVSFSAQGFPDIVLSMSNICNYQCVTDDDGIIVLNGAIDIKPMGMNCGTMTYNFADPGGTGAPFSDEGNNQVYVICPQNTMSQWINVADLDLLILGSGETLEIYDGDGVEDPMMPSSPFTSQNPPTEGTIYSGASGMPDGTGCITYVLRGLDLVSDAEGFIGTIEVTEFATAVTCKDFMDIDAQGVGTAGNGLVELNDCSDTIPNQIITVDWSCGIFENGVANPSYSYNIEVIQNGNPPIPSTGGDVTADMQAILIQGSDLVIGENEVSVILIYTDENGVVTEKARCTTNIIVNGTTSAVVCNDDVNIGLDSDCIVEITANSLLENACNDESVYIITVSLEEIDTDYCIDQNSDLVYNNLDVEALLVTNPSHIIDNNTNQVSVSIPGFYRYSIQLGDQSCSGFFHLEDGRGPVCSPATDEEWNTPWDVDCDGIVEVRTQANDPSGVDDLTNEYVLCKFIEANEGPELWFDILEAKNADLDGNGTIDVIGDFTDCTGIDYVYFEDEHFEICALEDLNGLPVDVSRYNENEVEVCDVYKRTWFAIDKKGQQNEQPCSQYVFSMRPKTTKIQLSEEAIFTCEEGESLAGPTFTVGIDNLPNGGAGSAHSGQYNAIAVPDNTIQQNADLSDKVWLLEPNTNSCKYVVSFHTDPQIDICATSYKKIYHWTVVNWCDGNAIYDEFTQLLKVEDNTAPAILLANGELADSTVFTIQTTYHECDALGTILELNTSDNCQPNVSQIDNVTIEKITTSSQETNVFIHQFPNGGDLQTDTDVALSTGNYTVTYFATDDCGNQSTATLIMQVIDERAPVAICNDELNITLTNFDDTLLTRIHPEDLDDSSYDNCREVSLKIRSADNVFQGDNDWGDFVEFSCEDVNIDDLKVELLVFEDRNGDGEFIDELTPNPDFVPGNGSPQFFNNPDGIDDMDGGLSSICSGITNVEENNNVTTMICEDLTLDCTDVNLAAYRSIAPTEADGTYINSPSFVGSCSNVDNINLRVDIIDITYDETCKQGIFVRQWTAVRIVNDVQQIIATCDQYITVNFQSDWTMIFPKDEVFECTPEEATIPATLTIDEILVNDGCDEWSMEVEDEVYDIVGQDGNGSCYKIVRTYKFINSCTWDVTNTELAYVNRLETLLTNGSAVELRHRSINFGRNDFGDEDDGDPYNEIIAVGDVTSPSLPDNNPTIDVEDDGALVLIDNNFDIGDNPQETDIPLFGRQYNERINNNDNVRGVYAENYGYFAYRQIIKVTDSVSPIIEDIEDVEFCDTLALAGTCGTELTICGPSVTECRLTYSTSYTVTNEQGIQIAEGDFPTSATPEDCIELGYFDYGVYTVKYRVEDGCGNFSNITYNITTKDCKAPTAYCNFGLSVDLMPSGMVELWASDFDAGSFDECNEPITVGFDAGGTQTMTFTCDNVGNNIIQLWAIDAAGNSAYCETFVNIQPNPNMDGSDGIECVFGLELGGRITTEAGDDIEDITVTLSGNVNTDLTTDITGTFSFTNVVEGHDYSITPAKDINHLNGVSTFDLVLIRKHILDLGLLDSPYKLIAADINRSESITTFDMVLLRKLILNIDTELSNNTSWRFVDAAYQFPNPTNPWTEAFSEIININDLNGTETPNFVGIKIGDVNGSAIPNNLISPEDRSNNTTFAFQVQDQDLKVGQTYTVDFTADMTGILGYQFTLNYAELDLVEIIEGVAKQSNFGIFAEQGVITTSWEGEALKDDVLFRLVFTAQTNAKLSELINLSSRYTIAEAYKDTQVMNVALDFGLDITYNTNELYQNVPNPFEEQTTIAFNLAKPSTATITISNTTGKVVEIIKDNFLQGMNTVQFHNKSWNTSGIFYYTLETNDFTATRKMIIMAF